MHSWERLLEALNTSEALDWRSLEASLPSAPKLPVFRIRSATSKIQIERPAQLFTLQPHWCTETNLVTFRKVAVAASPNTQNTPADGNDATNNDGGPNHHHRAIPKLTRVSRTGSEPVPVSVVHPQVLYAVEHQGGGGQVGGGPHCMPGGPELPMAHLEFSSPWDDLPHRVALRCANPPSLASAAKKATVVHQQQRSPPRQPLPPLPVQSLSPSPSPSSPSSSILPLESLSLPALSSWSPPLPVSSIRTNSAVDLLFLRTQSDPSIAHDENEDEGEEGIYSSSLPQSALRRSMARASRLHSSHRARIQQTRSSRVGPESPEWWVGDGYDASSSVNGPTGAMEHGSEYHRLDIDDNMSYNTKMAASLPSLHLMSVRSSPKAAPAHVMPSTPSPQLPPLPLVNSVTYGPRTSSLVARTPSPGRGPLPPLPRPHASSSSPNSPSRSTTRRYNPVDLERLEVSQMRRSVQVNGDGAEEIADFPSRTSSLAYKPKNRSLGDLGKLFLGSSGSSSESTSPTSSTGSTPYYANYSPTRNSNREDHSSRTTGARPYSARSAQPLSQPGWLSSEGESSPTGSGNAVRKAGRPRMNPGVHHRPSHSVPNSRPHTPTIRIETPPTANHRQPSRRHHSGVRGPRGERQRSVSATQFALASTLADLTGVSTATNGSAVPTTTSPPPYSPATAPHARHHHHLANGALSLDNIYAQKQFLTQQSVKILCPRCEEAIDTIVVPSSSRFRAKLRPVIQNLASHMSFCGGPWAQSWMNNGIHQCPQCYHVLGFIIQ
ncbi:hypothetical protein H4R33_002956 [Dimargaris cristalligena]|nr:hypothetical protein H4R33_002956 [Dimargaris cristalligena]